MNRPRVLAAHTVASVLLSLGVGVGCSAEGRGPARKRPVELIEIYPTSPELFVGQRMYLEALPMDRNGEDLGYRPAAWISSDENVATVSQFGLVEGKGPGETRISALIEGVDASVLLSVGSPPLGRVVIEPSSIELVKGRTGLLKARAFDVFGLEAEVEGFNWSSSDAEVAEAEVGGRVRGRSPGTATISASSSGVKGTATIKVVHLPIEVLAANEEHVSMYTGQSRELKVEAIAANGEIVPHVSLSWHSTDPKVANVDTDGVLRAWSPGNAEIVASVLDLKARIFVAVSEMPVTQVEVVPQDITGYAGDRFKLTTKTYGVDLAATQAGKVIWSSSDEELAVVDDSGEVELLQRGQVTVRATVAGVSGASTISIRRSPAIQRIEMQSAVSLWPGGTFQLDPRVFDVEHEQVFDPTLEWSSADSSVVSVDSSGLLEAHEAGEVDVYASMDGVAASVLVRVHNPYSIREVQIIGDDADLLLGERRVLRTLVLDHEGRSVTLPAVWTSSDEAVVSVNDGEVIAIGEGRAIIRAEVYGIVSSFEIQTYSLQFLKIQSRGQLICGLTTSRDLFCWGTATNFLTSSVPIRIGGDSGYRELSVGDSSVCVLDDELIAFCVGSNSQGQLGDGTRIGSQVPVEVAGGHKFRTIAVGGSMACGLTAEGKVYCWGRATMSQNPELRFESTVPVEVVGELRFSSLHRSGNVPGVPPFSVSCGLTEGNKAYCWGANDTGELGNGTTVPSASPLAVEGGLSFTSISVSSRGDFDREPAEAESSRGHGCGISLVGDAYCWGSNSSGELGIGTDSPAKLFPTEVLGGHKFKAVLTQTSYPRTASPLVASTSCGLDLEGRAFCWGLNDYILPPTGGIPHFSPVPVGGEFRFDSLSTGLWSLCGMSTNGKAYCWGAGPNLGVYDSGIHVTRPSLVLGQSPEP